MDARADSSAPYLCYNDASGFQRFFSLPGDRSATIGRDNDADVALPWDRSVSSLHAEVTRVGAHVLISDEGISRNGTFVNDERLGGRRRLVHGDILRVGSTPLAFNDPRGARRSSTTIPDAMSAMATVTLLFTDLVGSTELLGQLGDEAGDRVRRSHFAMLRDASRTHGGVEVKSLGDGLMLVFASARHAAACAIDMQRRMRSDTDTTHRGPLTMRIGLNAGEVVRAERDYFGMPVVVARRLCDMAAPGQTLTSDIFSSLVGSQPNYRFVPASPVELKGVVDPLRVFELVWRMDDAG